MQLPHVGPTTTQLSAISIGRKTSVIHHTTYLPWKGFTHNSKYLWDLP